MTAAFFESKNESKDSGGDSEPFQLYFSFSETEANAEVDLSSYGHPIDVKDNGIKNISIVFNNQKKKEQNDAKENDSDIKMSESEEEEFLESLSEYSKYVKFSVSNINKPKKEDHDRRRLDDHKEEKEGSTFTLEDDTELEFLTEHSFNLDDLTVPEEPNEFPSLNLEKVTLMGDYMARNAPNFNSFTKFEMKLDTNAIEKEAYDRACKFFDDYENDEDYTVEFDEYECDEETDTDKSDRIQSEKDDETNEFLSSYSSYDA